MKVDAILFIFLSPVHRLQKKTKRNGHFSGTVRLPVHNVAEFCNGSDGSWMQFGVVTPDGDSRVFAGRAQLLCDEGISVISDIDDTIKHSDVGSRRALLANTFLREFQSITGMAERYRHWASDGAAFHYVSSSPWQLYQPLAELRECAGFPQGSFHLRAFRLRDHMLRRVLLLRRHGKATVMRHLLRTFPRRRFVLIGDAGERDPELYGAAARRFRDRVAAIYIRRIAGHDWNSARAEKAFRGLPRELWHTFEHADQLPTRLSMMATC
jgi:phosphatidate phosphatase APP1